MQAYMVTQSHIQMKTSRPWAWPTPVISHICCRCSVTQSDSATQWTEASQASQSFTTFRSLLRLMSTESIMLSNYLIPCYPPALSLSQHESLFQWIGSLHQVAKVLELQHQSFQWTSRLIYFRIDWFDLLAVQGTLKSLHQHHNLKASILWCLAIFMG